ncbi:pre-rRNA-processing protein ESF1-like [Lolium rigidum]|uniref:pre-rRNA-processing protein ESF1-like n=1 Tax=Lolium rigidum TaxID=89674 RepID=UPI001F5D201C|nr:pre-rRNA-processing protein ESF1-like [Lolium rigidum]
MAPANSANLDAAKKGKRSNSKDERRQSNGKHELRTADEAKRKHEDGQEGKEHAKKPRKEKKATGTEAGAGEVNRGDGKMKRAMEDERFAPARTDPRFRPMRRKDAKVALDSRFSSMLTDPMFASSEAPVDKRGRRRKKGARANPLLHCYLDREEGIEKGKGNKESRKPIREEEDGELGEEDEQDEDLSSSSDDDEEEDVEDDHQNSVGNDIAHYLMARHDDTPTIDKETHRLAVANMDWNHIKAVDLYMVMKSCIPKGGQVLSVSIYPTEFGLKCMNIETTQGPSTLVGDDGDDVGGKYNTNNNDDDNGNDDGGGGGEEDSDLDSESENSKIRTYELNRLRYYHAVVVCDSSATADHLYTTLDGTELMKTANVFDLRFIPDSMEFKHPARDVATEEPLNYKQPDFETPALQRRKVKLTWDDNEPDRKKILGRKFKEDQLDGIRVYLAGSDSASDTDVDDSGDESLPNGVTKRKLTNKERLARLQPGDKSDEEQTDDQDMEITFDTELKDLSRRVLERKSSETKTVWEMHQEKMKEKRKARKRLSKDDDDYSDEDSTDEKDDFFDDEKSDEEAKPIKKQKLKARGKVNDKLPEKHFEREATREELELLVAADQDAANGAKGFNIKLKSKSGKRGKDSVLDKLPEIDLSKDPRFEDMFRSHLYALDPTNPQYKRSATFMRKQPRKKGAHAGTSDNEPPVEEPSLGNTMPPYNASAKDANQKHVGASTEKLQMLSAVKSLKRNLAAFKKASMSDR